MVSWLQTASTFTFRASSTQFSARKEQASNKRGSWYWKAYYRRAGKLCSAYLGKSEGLTDADYEALLDLGLCVQRKELNDGNEPSNG